MSMQRHRPHRSRGDGRAAFIPNIGRCLPRIWPIWTSSWSTVGTPEGAICAGRVGLRRSTTTRPACSCSIRTFSAAWKTVERAGRDRARRGAHVRRGGRSDQPGPAQAAGRLRRRYRGGRGAIAGQPDGVWRAVSGHHGLPRTDSSAACRAGSPANGRSPRQALLGADAANPRAAHPPRKSHEQHLHEPGPVRTAGDGLSGRAGAARLARSGRIVPAQSRITRPSS